MPTATALRLDPKIQRLSVEDAAKLELRVCCICGVITNANGMEECLDCDGFMCSQHKCDEHTCDCSTDSVVTQTLASISSAARPVAKQK